MLSRIITVTRCKAQINFMKIGFNGDNDAKELIKLLQLLQVSTTVRRKKADAPYNLASRMLHNG